ncbi:protein ViaA-like [Nilaparvata lugens]|uniref:protein ViaA-like n=1 Tax=Nilaparvata lugens TaxID=108931 RepID=UPI00193D5777|nr:protein ViaA-like [Nilaparvata lugens]
MLSLETLDLLLAITEGEMIEEMIVGMLAAPQLSVFFKKFRPFAGRWIAIATLETAAQERLQEAMCQLENNTQFYHNLNDTMELLRQLVSPFYEQAHALVDAADLPNHPLDDSFQTLFLQRWRISLTLQATMLHHQLLNKSAAADGGTAGAPGAERRAGAAAVGERTAAGRLWDMSKGQLQRGAQTVVEYGNFLQQQPELKKLAQQLARSYQAKAVQQQDAQPEPFRVMVQVPATLPEEVSGIHQSDDILRLLPPELATLGIEELEFEFYRRLLEKRLLSYRLRATFGRNRS